MLVGARSTGEYMPVHFLALSEGREDTLFQKGIFTAVANTFFAR